MADKMCKKSGAIKPAPEKHECRKCGLRAAKKKNLCKAKKIK